MLFYSERLESLMKKIISRSTLLLLLTIPMFSFADTTQWIADKRGCKVVNISPQEGESITWSGECKNGLATGEGTLTWFQQGVQVETYSGPMVNGYAEGRGRMVRGSGTYFGEWKKSMQHGKGRFEDADGSWYQGEWEDGQPHGRGQMLTPEGELLKGYWNKGEFEEAGAMPGRT
jgi:hypothetical protein